MKSFLIRFSVITVLGASRHDFGFSFISDAWVDAHTETEACKKIAEERGFLWIGRLRGYYSGSKYAFDEKVYKKYIKPFDRDEMIDLIVDFKTETGPHRTYFPGLVALYAIEMKEDRTP